MDVMKEYTSTMQAQIKNTTADKIQEIQQQLTQFNISDAYNKLISLDGQLADIIGMIQYMDSVIAGNPIDKTTANVSINSNSLDAEIAKLNDDMFKILDKNYIRSVNQLLLSQQANNEPITKLTDIFSIFMENKSMIDQNMKTYTDLEKAITINIDARIQSLSVLQQNISDALILTNQALITIKSSVFTEYEPSQIVPADRVINESQFQVRAVLDGLKKLIIGYDGMISDATLNTMATAYEHINLAMNEQRFARVLDELKSEMTDVLSKEQPTFQKGGQELAQSLVNFNVALQQTQRELGLFIASWNEYQQFKLRYYNYFKYHVYCLTDKKQVAKPIYIYINKATLRKYLDTINDIISKFMSVNTLDKQKEIIQYFNIYHYFTLKKLRKFIIYLTNIITDQYVIDIMKCTGEVYLSFMLFNQFRDFLDIYASQSK